MRFIHMELADGCHVTINIDHISAIHTGRIGGCQVLLSNGIVYPTHSSRDDVLATIDTAERTPTARDRA